LIRIVLTAFVVFAMSIVSPALAGRSVTVPPVRSPERSLHGYYLATFTTEVGRSLPESTFCLRFKPSGSWSNTGSEGFNGTYLISGKELFASGIWLPSPAVYMSFQASVNAGQGSGKFIITNGNGGIFGGGTFTMRGKQNSGCN
jgi:hypothetical protein